ncbi:DUF3574 domain-containing protein [Ferrovibrio sp.]|uniref:DUF3574 domain-containing protein n=1 Tax=Ferrovibrio sp. TaxID=1917215 RepID=UPI002621BAB8|nr:DUF3574 domain-containing protein [Ferrovibrio sp.]
MFEETFLKVGERLGALQARVLAALLLAFSVLIILVMAGIYVWFDPLALCRQQSSSLFFGTRMPEDRKVEVMDWARFVDETIVPRFPDGFTLLDGQGGWRSTNSGTVREATHILLVLHDGSASAKLGLDAIAADYKAKFSQDSVLRLDQCAVYRF